MLPPSNDGLFARPRGDDRGAAGACPCRLPDAAARTLRRLREGRDECLLAIAGALPAQRLLGANVIRLLRCARARVHPRGGDLMRRGDDRTSSALLRTRGLRIRAAALPGADRAENQRARPGCAAGRLAVAGRVHDPEHYDQIFSAHGTLMIFFVAMPFVIGLMNFVVPLQLGVRDVAFPTLNSVGFWLTATGSLLVNISLVVGEFARTGWLPYPPLSELNYSPGVGIDYYLWSLEISGVGTLVAGVNLVTTVLKVRT